jgi:iron complex outermembrane receptor protein
MILNIKDKNIKGLNYEVGARSHHYDIEVFNQLSPRVMVLSNKEDNYAWSLGADYNFKKDNKFFGHLSRSYRSPRLDEIITVGPSTSINPLKHQFSHEVELGYEHNLSDQRYKISAFKTLIKNQIFYNPTSFANENYDPSVHKGIELEFDKKISEKVEFNANSTFMNSYVTKGPFKGNETPYVPKWRANTTLSYEIDKNSRFNYSYKYFGKTRAGNDDNYLLPKSKSYQISDINYSYKFKNLTLNSFVNNVLNEKYYTNLIIGTGNVGYVYPQAGRTMGLEITAEF